MSQKDKSETTTKSKSADKNKEEPKKGDTEGFLEEDDEFEEFPAEGISLLNNFLHFKYLNHV